MKQYTCVDAFCGAGGLSIGLANAGFDIKLGFDNDPLCIQTLQMNPKIIKHPVITEDVRALCDNRLLSILGMDRGELDFLAGGPPCQGFSVQRTVGTDEDSRNMLVHDYGNLIVDALPRFFLMENVPGIGGKRGRALLNQFCERIKNNGYIIHKKVLNAADFGVPQRRRRVFIIGERCVTSMSKFSWPPALNKRPPTVRETIGHLPPPPEDCSDHPQYFGHRADRLSEKNKERLRALKVGQSRVDLPDRLLANCHQAPADVVGHRNVYGRMDWDDVAPTITARFDSFTRGKFGHPEQVRSISLYEGALLQTFPKDYKFKGNKVDIARQIGNAIPPELAETLGRAVLKGLIAHDGGGG